MADVHIFGTRPSALLLACELLRRGHDVRVVGTPPAESCSVVVQPRTLEILEHHSLADRLVGLGQKINGARFLIDGEEKLALDFTSLETRFPFQLNVPMAELSRLLVVRLAGLGGQVDREATGSARFTALCDQSDLRPTTQQTLTFADVAIKANDAVQSIGLAQDGVVAAFPLAGQRARIVVSGRLRSGEELQARAARALPDLGLTTPPSVTVLNVQHGLAGRYVDGARFLCDAAAHLQSPLGGQDVNGGMQDVWNLAWKMSLVLRGQAGESLLASYHAERHPVGQFFAGTTDRLFEQAGRSGGPLTLLRRVVAPGLARAAHGKPHLLHLIALALTNLGVHYQSSPIVGRGTPDASDGPLPGDRIPGGHLTSDRFQLIVFSDSATIAPPIEAIARELDASHPGLVEVAWRPAARQRMQWLVRPDGHLGWRGAGWDPAQVRKHLDDVLGTH